LLTGAFAMTSGVAQGAPAHAAAKTQTVVLRGSAADRGTFEVIVWVRSRSHAAVKVRVFLTGRRPHTLVANPWWGASTHFRVRLHGKRLTVRAVSTPPAVAVRATLIRVGAPPAAPPPAGQNSASVPPSPATITTQTPSPPSTPSPAPTPPNPTPPAPTPPSGPYQSLYWHDEFTQDFVNDGSTPNNLPGAPWALDYAGGCGDNTLSNDVTSSNPSASRYVNLTPNGLAINAIETSPGSWTSAQVDSAGDNVSFSPGSTIEARIYMPTGQGLCPAFWMVSDNRQNPGEIDIVEAPTFLGENTPLAAYFTLHGPGPVSQQWESSASSVNLSGWHTYAVTWSSDAITWSVDGTPYATADAAALIPGANWNTYIDSRFHLIFDLAVGGWPCGGASPGPNCEPPPSATMLVQWVRVWT
jgi:hypothetical protein